MSIQRTSTSSSPLTPQWKYDVFLSFRGYDTRRGFTHNLYTALDHEGIRTFRDDPKLRKGEVISPALLAAIEESRIAIIVLSKNYASSTWCLDELVRILECMTARETVLPIFYDVEPSDIRKQTGSFGEAFANHEERFRDDKEKLLRWRSALTEVANLSGWNSKEWYEAKLISDIVKDIQDRMSHTSFGYAKNLVGMDRILQPVYLHLGVEDDVRFIGIWGMGGIGKTTMVRAVHDKISHKFEFSFLLTNVRDSVEKGGLLNLQKQLLSGMIRTEQANRIFDLQRGATALQTWLRGKKVLLILDDVNDSSHLKYLAGNQGWFGLGSRVLITTRNEHLLIEHGLEKRLKAEVLKDDDSLQLFSLKAFKRGYPEDDFLDLSVSIIEYAQGLPLALEVLGSSLYGRDRSAWDSKLSQLEGRVLNSDIFDALKISYDDLDPNEKKIFLDIACFFNGQDKRRVTDVLNSCDVFAKFGIDVLMERSLLSDSYGGLWMHDLLREMGQNIVLLESPNKLGKRSRLWLFEDVRYVLTKNTGTEAIEGIFLDSTESSGAEIDVTPKSFSMMRKLRYLKIQNANLPKGLEYLPDSLRILDWTRYPLKSLPAYFNPQKLWELNLCHSCIEHVHIGKEPLYNLKMVNLSHSLNLVITPNFKDMPYLELLSLEGCIRLYEVDQGIEVLGRLSLLNLKDCKNLVHFASSVCALKSLKVLNLSGCSNLKKLPNDMDHLESLEELHVNGTGIRELPSSIGFLKNLKELSLAGCKAQSVNSWNMMFNPLELLRKRNHTPAGLSLPCLSGLYSLTNLNLSDCNLSEEVMPDGFGCLASLRSLNLRNNQFVSLPKSIRQLSRLESLNVQGCHKLQVLPEFGSDVYVNGTNRISLELHSPALFPPPLFSDFSRLAQQSDEEYESFPEQVKGLVSLYFSLFSSDHKFRKDELIRMWIAEGFVKHREGKRMEDIGSTYFNSLHKKGILVPSRYDSTQYFDSIYSVPIYNPSNLLYKVNPVKLSELGDTNDLVKYFKTVNGNLDGAPATTRYLYLNCKGIDEEITFGVVKRFKHLRTLLLSGCGSSIKHVPRDLFLLLKDMRTLDLSQTLISELPSSIRNAKALRYLDLSSTYITRLPESIDSLQYLQTIKLRGCVHFLQLPKGMKKLINLRHIDLDIRQLRSMPPYLGNLTNLQTLSAFLVGREDGCSIAELKNMNDLNGVLRISRLENVLNKEEAEEAALIDKKCLQRLELRWSNVYSENKEEQEKILECLQPHSGLKELHIQHYAGSALPTWISNPSFSELVVLTLYRCRNCTLLPAIGQLPMLRSLSIIEMNEVKEISLRFLGTFGAPKLEILEIDTMLNLKEWKELLLGHLPSLLKLTVDSCPQLNSLPPLSHIKSLKHLEFRRCPKLLSLPSEGLPTSVESFIVIDCPKLKEKYRKSEGEEWSKIRHVPNIWFDCEEVERPMVKR